MSRIRSFVAFFVPSLAVALASPAVAQLTPTVVSVHENVPEAGSDAGWSVAAGDLNGDGYADAIVGIPHGDTGLLADTGRVLVRFGPSLKNSITVVAPVPQSPAGFGYAVAVSDVNGDGIDDLIVGAPDEQVSVALTDVGRAYVFYGPSLAVTTTLSMPTPTAGADFGQAVAAGDVDGDGKAEVVVGAPEAASGTALIGRAYVFSGGTLALRNTLTDATPAAGDHYGWAVGVGDVDGDGKAEVVVGAPEANAGAVVGGGRVHVYTAPALTSVQTLFEPTPETGANLGETVALGDINGDGRADIAAGIPDAKALGINDSGECAVFFAPSFASSVVLGEPVVELGADFGFSEAIGDVDGDGFGDVVIGAQDSTANGEADAGEAFVFFGPALTTFAALVPDPVHNGDDFGYSSATGDFNGDGLMDPLIGAKQGEPGGVVNEGRAFAFIQSRRFKVSPLGVSAAAGGPISFELEGGAAAAHRNYAILGSTLGSSPCFTIGSVCAPIHIDPVFTPFLLNNSVIAGSIGTFGGSGKAVAGTFLPAGVATAGVGLRFTFAWLTTNPFNIASQSVVFEIVP